MEPSRERDGDLPIVALAAVVERASMEPSRERDGDRLREIGRAHV